MAYGLKLAVRDNNAKDLLATVDCHEWIGTCMSDNGTHEQKIIFSKAMSNNH
jgi:hypothetical protein